MIILHFIYLISNIVFSLVGFLLGTRVFLKFFGASTTAPFVTWVYKTTEPLLYPFVGIFPNPQLTGFVLEFSSLFALVIYSLVGYFISDLISNMINQEEKKGKKERRHREQD